MTDTDLAEHAAPEREHVAPGHAAPGPDLAPDAGGAPAQLTVLPWWDPDLATGGVDPRDPYVERFWLGILGPSTVLLLRRFARGLDEHPGGFRVGVLDTSLALGLGRGTGRNAPITRTINRAVGFGLLRPAAIDRVEVRTHLPLLTPRQLRQLPPVLRQAHSEWTTARAESPAH